MHDTDCGPDEARREQCKVSRIRGTEPDEPHGDEHDHAVEQEANYAPGG